MKKKLKFSVLDLVPVYDGQSPGDAIRNSGSLARRAEELGYTRYLIAEHHNTPILAGAATSVVVQYVLANTRTIRVGAGGVMLPNHSPLQVAETYASLDFLYPGRVDLGLGRAPGTDPLTAQMIARRQYMSNQAFFDDVMQLVSYFDIAAGGPVQAYPGPGASVRTIILGSSTHSAYIAAAAGLPYAYAMHFSLDQAKAAISIYRDRFHPSSQLEEPYVMVALWNFAAPTSEASEERYAAHMTLLDKSMGGISQDPEKMPRPLTSSEKILLSARFGASLRGSPKEVRKCWDRWDALAHPDEVILATFCGSVDDTAESLRIAKETLEGR